MTHVPDMDTQVSLFLLRSRARTAEIQRRSSMNQTLDIEAQTRHRVAAEGWERCLLREGPRHAEEVIQLWCVLQAKRAAFEKLSGDQSVVDQTAQSMRADEKLNAEIDKWIVGSAFHDTLRSTQFKTASGRYPPLLLQQSPQLKQGKERVVAILRNELKREGSGERDYMHLNYQLEGQATRNRETLVDYAKGLWFDHSVYTRAIKTIAAGDTDLLLTFDQGVFAAYEQAVHQPSLEDIMVKAFAALCAQTPYGAQAFDKE
ncbi:hypothetical protein [uncultured Stenotrophomonas sp.]|uniref:hypothetical protein n=1 Tax=uncultured Stenotrophomonas sp. TaxID=165438 RepID=UPI0028D7C596|nr:hypothetical protein [uncultured Stenotrophomonas sp.]